MAFLLALDQGTTSSRAIVFDETASIRGVDRAEYAQHFPADGWVEHDPADIWSTQVATARGALKAAGIDAASLAAVGITNQRETTIVWDRATGTPIYNAIVWQDRRTAPECERLRAAGAQAVVARKTGLLLDPYFSATKIAWLLDNVPGARDRAERGDLAFGTVDTWLIWNLTGGTVHVTDYTNASRTLLFDIERLQWDDELLALFRVPRALLPGVLPSCAAFGRTSATALGASVAIGGVAGDQQAALFGQACFAAGSMKCTYGTGAFAMLNTGPRIVRDAGGLLSTVAFSVAPGQAAYALEGSIFVTGAAVQWLRDGLGIIADARDVETLASQVPDNGGVYFVPALTGLGAPYWDPHARGTILGLTRGSNKAHVARATLEAMAYQTADVVAALAQSAGLRVRELRVDGGGSTNDLAMQLVADTLGVDTVRPRVTETTALGAAYLAGLHAGVWSGYDEIAALWAEQARFAPRTDDATRERLSRAWRRAVERARNWDVP